MNSIELPAWLAVFAEFRGRESIRQNCLHQLPVVSQHRRLARVEAVRLGPTETETKAQFAVSCSFILRSRIIRHIEAGDANRTGSTRDFHETVEHDCRRFGDVAAGPRTLGLEADAIDRTADLRHA